MTSLKNYSEKNRLKTNTYISLLFLTSLVASCSVNKYLPPGEKLFRGEVITIIKNPEIKESNRSLKNTINLATRPNANKYIFGFPYKVWMWYAIGEPKREKGIKSFLRKRLAEEPVFGNRINTAVCAENIESLMENLGYFHTKAKGDTFSDAHFIKAKYTVTVQPQYKINEICFY